MIATVTRNAITADANFYIVERRAPLLGLDLIRALNFHIASEDVIDMHSNSMHAIQAITRVLNCADEHLHVQGECVKGFIHKVQVDNTFKPVQQKVRRLPLCVRQDVSNEIQRLLKAGIIEPIDASPWVSPLVVTKKKQGAVRMCVDLCEPN